MDTLTGREVTEGEIINNVEAEKTKPQRIGKKPDPLGLFLTFF